jgi:hypothetical protein
MKTAADSMRVPPRGHGSGVHHEADGFTTLTRNSHEGPGKNFSRIFQIKVVGRPPPLIISFEIMIFLTGFFGQLLTIGN